MENHSSSHKPATSLLILLILGVVILGILVALQNREIHRLGDEQKSAIVAVEPAPAPAVNMPTATSTQNSEQGSNLVVATKIVAGKYAVTQYCDGTVVSANFIDSEPVKYCLGKNTLIYSDDTRTKTVASETVITYQEAPVLLDVQYVSSTMGLPRLLIAYAPNTCFTRGDCREIGPQTYFTFNIVFNVGDETFRKISSYPGGPDGGERGVWNVAGTRMIFIVDTCGESGCELSPIFGYNLDQDVQKNVTIEKAIGGNYPASETDIFGPHWKSVEWVTDSKFTATIVDPSGKTKKISGTF